jgi:hypothetical protein
MRYIALLCAPLVSVDGEGMVIVVDGDLSPLPAGIFNFGR